MEDLKKHGGSWSQLRLIRENDPNEMMSNIVDVLYHEEVDVGQKNLNLLDQD